MSSRAGAASVVVSSLGALGVVIDLINVTVAGGPNADVSAFVVPVYSIADVVGITTASFVASMNRDRRTLAPLALFLGSAPVLAFYIFLVATRPDEAAKRAEVALSVLGSAFEGLAQFLVTLFT